MDPRLAAFLDAVLKPLDEIVAGAWELVPRLLSALILVILGLVLARGLRTVVEAVSGRLKMDERTSRVGVNEVLSRLGMGKSPSFVLGAAVYWAILLSFLVSAATTLRLGVLTALAERFLRFLPSLVTALVIAFAGLAFAQFMASVVAESARANNLRGGEGLSRATLATVWVLTGLLAFEQLGLAATSILSLLQIAVAAAGLALALAFGLGGRDLAADYLRQFLGKKND